MKIQPIIDWMVCNLAEQSSHISKLAIYGSIARNSDEPNDCDLLIVSSANVESEIWLSLRQHINSLETDFMNRFKLPLNVALLTEGEWIENKSFYKDLLPVKIKAG